MGAVLDETTVINRASLAAGSVGADASPEAPFARGEGFGLGCNRSLIECPSIQTAVDLVC